MASRRPFLGGEAELAVAPEHGLVEPGLDGATVRPAEDEDGGHLDGRELARRAAPGDERDRLPPPPGPTDWRTVLLPAALVLAIVVAVGVVRRLASVP